MSQEKVAEIIDLNASRAAAEAGDEETAGEFLANARRAAGLDLAAVSDAIKVKTGHLEAIEASNAAALPATPYAVGFVKVYARFLGLDADALARQFKADIGADVALPAEQLRREAGPHPADAGESAKLASIFGVAAIVIFMLWVAIQVAGESERQTRSDGTAAPGPGVVLKNDAAPTPQPRPAAALPGGPPVVAVTEGESPAIEDDGIDPLASSAPATAAGEAAGQGEINAPPAEDPDIAAPQGALNDEAQAQAPAEETDGAFGPGAAETDSPALPEIEPVRAPPEQQPVAPRQEPPAPVIVNARLTRSVAPRYPRACDRGATDVERVTVIFDITAEGRAANARVLNSTNACFNESALAALGRWRFDPKTIDGAPRPDLAKQATLNFQR